MDYTDNTVRSFFDSDPYYPSNPSNPCSISFDFVIASQRSRQISVKTANQQINKSPNHQCLTMSS
jgi:hypothetical protein